MTRKTLFVFGIMIILFVSTGQLWQRWKIASGGVKILLPIYNHYLNAPPEGSVMEIAYENIVPLNEIESRRGKIAVVYDYNGVGRFAAMADDDFDPGTMVGEREHIAILNYEIKRPYGFRSRVGRDASISFGAETFFFPRDRSAFYQNARYAVLMAGKSGRTVLIDLADENYQSLSGEY